MKNTIQTKLKGYSGTSLTEGDSHKVSALAKKKRELPPNNEQIARLEEQLSNDAALLVSFTEPYSAQVTICGVAPLLFHRWSTESVEEKAGAAKNSKAKKTDDLESYVYRDKDQYLGASGTWLAAALAIAGKSIADPRSPRKSASDLIKAGVQVVTLVAPFEPKTKKWDFEDRQRVVIQRSGITRTRPAMSEGWSCSFDIVVLSPEYVSPRFLHDLLERAGKFVGMGDYRPSHGRFRITKFNTSELT